MKRFVFIGFLSLCLSSAEAQLKTTTPGKQSNPAAKKSRAISLTSTNSYAAKSGPPMIVTINHFRITDPTVVAMTERANGKNVFISSSGIVGMSKRAYGFANGMVLFRSTVATSSGSTGGCSSVGSGGSVSGIGSGGSFIGLNGKSPYAGLGMWGTAQGLSIY